jgi:adenine-specific DNA glycosylase
MVEVIPKLRARRQPVNVQCAVLLVRKGDRILLRQRTEMELLPGIWDLPGTFSGDRGDVGHGLEIAGIIPVVIEIGSMLGVMRHVITYRRITLEVHEAWGSCLEAIPPGWRWCTVEEAMGMALSSPARKILEKWGRVTIQMCGSVG